MFTSSESRSCLAFFDALGRYVIRETHAVLFCPEEAFFRTCGQKADVQFLKNMLNC